MTKFTAIGLFLLTRLLTAAPVAAQESDADLYERRCASCHSLNAGVLMVGPHLRGIYGRKAGIVGRYRYSPALKNFDAVWDEKTLHAYLSNPSQYLPRTKKPTAFRDATQLNRIIKYLKATQPVAVPE